MMDASKLRSGKGHRDENFPVASWLIHARHRALILAFYEFVRCADDIADHPSLSAQEKVGLLDHLEQDLLGESDGNAEAAALRAEGLEVILLGEPGAFGAAVKSVLPGGADDLFDTTSQWVDAAVAAITEFGTIATIAAPRDGHVRFPLLDFYHAGGVLVGINTLLYDTAACARMLEPIAVAFDRGEIPPPVPIREASLEQGPDVYRAIDAGSAEKFVFVMR